MVLLRGVFWLALVAAVVPYSTVDLSKATFAIDEPALMARVARLPQFCRDNRAICEKAGALAALASKEGLALAQTIVARLKN
jgi:hypothetical protein